MTSHQPRDVDPAIRLALEKDVLRIVNSPSDGERTEEVHLVAKDVLLLLGYADQK